MAEMIAPALAGTKEIAPLENPVLWIDPWHGWKTDCNV